MSESLIFFGIIYVLGFSIIGAVIGEKKGYGALGFFLGFFLGVIGVLIIAIMGENNKNESRPIIELKQENHRFSCDLYKILFTRNDDKSMLLHDGQAKLIIRVNDYEILLTNSQDEYYLDCDITNITKTNIIVKEVKVSVGVPHSQIEKDKFYFKKFQANDKSNIERITKLKTLTGQYMPIDSTITGKLRFQIEAGSLPEIEIIAQII